MIEDDIYRTSSQYRYWSYTQSGLADLRHTTNKLASKRVKAAFRRSHLSTSVDDERVRPEIETLTVEEELRIVQWGCSKVIEVAKVMKQPIPPNIVATAIQYLRRFYLTNSPMTYHPKQIIMCALFLATKSDHWHISLHNFVAQLDDVTEEDVKAPEFLLMQGLRFTLQVRHPMRGLDGGVAEMQTLSREGLLPGFTTQTGQVRIGKAADKAKTLLRVAALMTDAYFLYTPSQIWLAAMMASDRELTMAFLGEKLRMLGDAGEKLYTKLVDTISSCAKLLASYTSPEDDPQGKKEMKRIGKKLHICQNPEKLDIVAVTRAKAAEKREGSDGYDAEKAQKKRKLERQKLEKDGDIFGSDLQDVK